MEKDTDLVRLCGGMAIPLALLAQRTGTTTADASSIQHTQASIGFSASFMLEQVLASRTPERAIGLKRKVGSGETPTFQDVAVVGGPYPEPGADEGGCLAVCWLCGGMAGANSVVRTGVGSRVMAQFEPDIPYPLGHDPAWASCPQGDFLLYRRFYW